MPAATFRDDRSVFLNVPFDAAYEDCFLALLASLTGLGLRPRSVLEVPPSQDRLRRLYRLVKACRYSLHDLSRVELSEGADPRFNMPFEAGLATAIALDRRRHERFLLESQRYRLQRTCSDLNGTDPEIHGGTAEGILRCVLNLFGRAQASDEKGLRRIYERLRVAAGHIRAQAGPLGVYTPASFRSLVLAAQTIDATLRDAREAARPSDRKKRKP